ncbi:hypothetical protein DFH08DRAFT_838959 [Mycena albidolilacea]|uniref:Uncharacterized protein n=1 Tax=Mycena albidolilacea TaxID=1033008 RepID=A0AAD7ANZ3_9AGAR|nr:hypothetical protein DFH08DRAFT_838959 [Mycena albidolilacea]
MLELPLELECQIFELAFKPNSRNIQLKVTLCLVARRVQVWIDRIFHGLVAIRDDRGGQRFLSLIRSNSKPADFFRVVKTLSLAYSLDGGTAGNILAVCPNVQSLTCWVASSVASRKLPLLISRLPLQRLSIQVSHFSRIPATLSETWLSSLTHLDLYVDTRPPPQLSQLLTHLAHLSHICLSSAIVRAAMEYVEMVCSSRPRFQVLIVPCHATLVSWVEAILPPTAKDDDRVVVQAIPQDVREDWAYVGHSDMWSLAEASVKLRKNSVGQE